MIKIDLITGFLGAGKTTFIKKYVRRLVSRGVKVGILENDYGAVNVDSLLLSELEGDLCGLESVAGACDSDCHRRRFKTKLIALAMSGYDRVVVEPSGIFDVDEFFDSLHEPPLDNWYEIGSVIAIVDAALDTKISKGARYLLASQSADAGMLLLSKAQQASAEDINNTLELINRSLGEIRCQRRFTAENILAKPWDDLTDEDFDRIESCGCASEGYVKLPPDSGDFRTLYFMNSSLSPEELMKRAEKIFDRPECGEVFRVKGFAEGENGWVELNAVKGKITLSPISRGQDIVIVIGEGLNEEAVKSIFENPFNV